jgi:Heavy-metal resistance protein CzcE
MARSSFDTHERIQIMKQLFIAALLAAGAAAATPSFALTKADEIGEPGSPAAADRTLQVTPSTRYLNVQSGETVHLDVNGRRVTWSFAGRSGVVKLQDIVPGAPDVAIYVAPAIDN